MHFNPDGEKPIYVQMAEWIEENILSGAFPEETQIPSTTDISAQYKINPATALKGMNILVDKGIIYKKRGLGMFVSEGAAEKLRSERKQEFFEKFVKSLMSEAEKLGITKNEVIDMIERGGDK
ncbi:MAG: GntR family transcriptional regulator [Oscillospiraceae bacterium]|nr:GntR family transcriptional regulator [Oscillospiraceae bacterium]MDY2864848.1 GntR family transcriptional regulator [Oscillospiraceae bacterium]